jgi:hypothetical protein
VEKTERDNRRVLDAIFPGAEYQLFAYPVLAEYLRILPLGEFGKAFDFCIDLEGTQTPDDLVEFFLEIWAQRDPKRCWQRMQQLFRVVGIEDGWLTYDVLGTATQPGRKLARPRITLQDRKAISTSRFWLRSASLRSFPLASRNLRCRRRPRADHEGICGYMAPQVWIMAWVSTRENALELRCGLFGCG